MKTEMGDMVLLRKLFTCIRPVLFITQNRMADTGKVHTNLVSAPGVQITFKKRTGLSLLDHAIRRLRLTTFAHTNHTHFDGVAETAPNGRINSGFGMLWDAMYNRQIRFFDRTILELFLETCVIFRGLRNQKTSSRTFIQSVYENFFRKEGK